MIGVISVTKKGDILAEKLKENLNCRVFLKSKEDKDLKSVTKEFMQELEGVIFISSTGIAVRLIAPYLKSKAKDPAVVVVDVNNNFTISLVSGHLGGANRLTSKVAKILNNTEVITTATDGMNIVAPDMIAKENDLVIDDLKICKDVAALLVNGKKVYFNDEKDIISTPKGYIKEKEIRDDMILVTNKLNIQKKNNLLKLVRKDVVLGIGCRKDTDEKKLREFVLKVLEENNYDKRSVIKIGSIDVKKNEKAIISLAKFLGCEFITFNKDEINSVDEDYEGSNFVFKTVGVRCVCEPVIYLMDAKVKVKKIKYEGMTLSIGEKYI